MDAKCSALLFMILAFGGVYYTRAQRQCPRLQKPWNGRVIGTCSGLIGAQCLFACREPYVLVGSRARVCREDGSWSGTNTACELNACDNCCTDCGDRGCPGLPDPANGYAEGQCSQGVVGQSCLFRCNNGYSLEGQSRLTCLDGGVWNALAPRCRRNSGTVIEVTALCPTLSAPPGGRLLGSCTSAATGDTCQLICLSGYRPTDSRVLVCQPNGIWSNDLPRCVGAGSDCPSLVVPQAITSGTCNPGRAGQSCTVTCQSGQTGSYTLVCLSTGEWSGTIPTCSAGYNCVPLNPPANGEYSGQCVQASAGQACTFSCHVGYTLSGIATLYCQPGGQWSSLTPSCIRSTSSTTCPSLSAPSRGILIGVCSPGRVGETCAFACDEGYELVGQRTLTCLSDGRWSSSLPYCQRDPDGNGDNCAPLYPPPNGELVECDNRPGGRCVVVCEPGYLRSGSRVRTCLQNGVWSGFAPTCTRKVGYTYTYKVVPLWSLVFG